MELSADQIWDRALESARGALPEQSFRTWLSGTEAVAMSEEELIVQVPSDFHREWIRDKFTPLLQEALTSVLGRSIQITYRTAPGASAEGPASLEVVQGGTPTAPAEQNSSPDRTSAPASAASPGSSVPSPADASAQANLNERYTFDRFVVGTNNQLAAAAGHAVAEQPAGAYNPLFLYGGVGLGKTHLMHAIGHHVLEENPRVRVAYVTTEHFTNELITSIQNRTTKEFKRRFRDIDLLLVDDVHFLKGKEWTQEEFFHTFNALYDARKQIVLTSDRPPKEIPGLEDRLVSRFEWGLVADMKPPDYETRVAILRKKAHDDALILHDDVIDLIARHCTRSVRELEGAVIKLLAYSSLRKEEITEGLARQALKGTLGDDPSRPADLSPEIIRDAVAAEWGVTPSDLASRRRTRGITVPRQVAMFLIKELVDPPLVRIGQLFGGRDHSTVIHSIRKTEEELEVNDELRARVEALTRRLQGGQGE